MTTDLALHAAEKTSFKELIHTLQPSLKIPTRENVQKLHYRKAEKSIALSQFHGSKVKQKSDQMAQKRTKNELN